MITILDEDGAPTPVVWTKLLAPASLMAAVDPAEVDAAAKASPLWATYAQEIDRESARELLAAKMAAGAGATAAPPPPPPADTSPGAPAPGGVSVPPPPPSSPAPERGRSGGSSGSGSRSGSRSRGKDDGNVVTDYLRSREGRTMINTVVRGVFGMLKKR